MRDVMDTIVRDGYGSELGKRSISQSRQDFRLYAEEVKKSVAQNGKFRKEDADYAVDSISFALGMTESEPGYPVAADASSDVSRRYRIQEPLRRGQEEKGLSRDDVRGIARAALIVIGLILLAVLGVLALLALTPIFCLMGPVSSGLSSLWALLFG